MVAIRHLSLGIILLLQFLQFFPGLHGWGKEGHFVTCKIAQGFLNEETANAVRRLLPEYADGNLASLCSWADEIRHRYKWRWTSPLHYIDTPDFRCNYDYCRDCHDYSQKIDRCVAGAIFNYSSQLITSLYSEPQKKYNLTESLLFLSHFVGDIHQPLHVAFTGDEGGNTIIVHWYHRKSNLHHVWDNMIIDTALKTFYDSDIAIMIQSIQNNILNNWSSEVPLWENCLSNYTICPNFLHTVEGGSSCSNFPRYASESISLACKLAYMNATPGSILTDEYFLSRLPVVEKRLAQGGVRLASILNRLLTPYRPISSTW